MKRTRAEQKAVNTGLVSLAMGFGFFAIAAGAYLVDSDQRPHLNGKLIVHHHKEDGIGLRVLAVTAHPDDEYCFAAAAYRLNHELGGRMDQIIITNGEGGFKYSGPSEGYYGAGISEESMGRKLLPRIREEEHRESARILGIRKTFYLQERDNKFTRAIEEGVTGIWNVERIRAAVRGALNDDRYDQVWTLLPLEETHAHHKMATIIALEEVAKLPADRRPIVMGCANRQADGKVSAQSALVGAKEGVPYTELKNFPITHAKRAFEFDRDTKFGLKNALSYQIYVNWMIAANKSQGVFQTYMGKDRYEEFWSYDLNESAQARTPAGNQK